MFQQSLETPNYFSKQIKDDPYHPMQNQRNSSQMNLKQGTARMLNPI